jgi:hypothetical protein
MGRYILGAVVLILVLAGVCSGVTVDLRDGNEITVVVDNSLAEFSFDKVGGYDYVRGPGVVYRMKVFRGCRSCRIRLPSRGTGAW